MDSGGEQASTQEAGKLGMTNAHLVLGTFSELTLLFSQLPIMEWALTGGVGGRGRPGRGRLGRRVLPVIQDLGRVTSASLKASP